MFIKLIRSVYNFIRTTYKLYPSKKRGNLIVGHNTIIQNCEVIIARPEYGRANVIIGEDSNVSCRFIILNPKAKVTVGKRVFIGSDTIIFCYQNIQIEDDVMISWGCTITDTNAHSIKASERLNDVLDWNKGEQYKNWSHVKHGRTIIRKLSWIGFNSIILKNVEVGVGSVIGAGSVVTSNVPPYTIMAGNPAKAIREIPSDEQ